MTLALRKKNNFRSDELQDSKIVSYINNLRRNISKLLVPNKTYKAVAYPYDNGSIIRIEFVDKELGKDEVAEKTHTISEAMRKAGLEIFDKNDKRVNPELFRGTNILGDKQVIFLIKDNTSDEWTDEKAKSDIKKIVYG